VDPRLFEKRVAPTYSVAMGSDAVNYEKGEKRVYDGVRKIESLKGKK